MQLHSQTSSVTTFDCLQTENSPYGFCYTDFSCCNKSSWMAWPEDSYFKLKIPAYVMVVHCVTIDSIVTARE